MKHLVVLCLAVASLSFSYLAVADDFDLIPQAYRAHPELGLPVESRPYGRASYELVHLRTEHSRVILNDNQTRTTIQSSVPLHYQDGNGYWLSLRHELTARNDQFIFPSQNPSFVIDPATGNVALIGSEQQTAIQASSARLVSGERLEPLRGTLSLADAQTLMRKDAFPGIDIESRFFPGTMVNTVVLQSPEVLSPASEGLVFEQDFQLPAGYTLTYDDTGSQQARPVVVLDALGRVASTIHPPVLFDAQEVTLKNRHLYSAKKASLRFEQTGESTYTVSMTLPADWLNDPARVFPLRMGSVITVDDHTMVDSCFFPTYQQSTVTVEVPQGETVLWTDFEHDFVAVNDGWLSDQRSFIAGPAGQTEVFSGSGNTEGTQTYSINLSEVGNGVSPGEVEYVFHAARTWGGSGCNASFNFINRRVVSVTYGTIEFGDGPVTINEYSASNRSFEDGFNRTEDWIELHNLDPDRFFDLSGFHLSNDAQDPTQWQITDGVIPPGGHVIVFASRRDISSGMVQHANFNLTQLRPDQVVLADPDGNILESHEIVVTQVFHSVGRITDGADEWGVFASPSPGNVNAGAFAAYASRPDFSADAGTYQGSVVLEMSSGGVDEEIRYTIDGSTPSPSSALYTGPITLDQTTVVRARTFSTDSSILPSFIETRTYLVNEDISLPVFSFSGDQDMLDLFGGNQFLRPLGHFEYFESDGQFVDGNFGDFNKHGNDSWNYAQRGVDFISRDDYGYQRRLEHKFFETSDRTRFRRLMVKAAANDNFPGEPGGAHIRDSYIQHLSQIAGLDMDERSSTNVLVFVNGQYWGVYDLRERVDDNNFTDFYYGQDYIYRESDLYLQYLKTWAGTEAHFGNQPAISDWTSLRQYVQNNDMGDPVHFEYVQSQLNIDSLIDYFVINSWIVSRDWLNYNTGWWRGLNPAGSAREWRYTLWDMEAALGHFINYTGLPNPTATAPPCQAENLTVGDGHTTILKELIQQNPEVRQRYVGRYIDLLNTHFSTENSIALLDSMIDDIAPEMPRHIERWGGDFATWLNNVQDIRDFITDRNDFLMNGGLQDCYQLTGPFQTEFAVMPADGGSIRMNAEWLPDYPFNAQLFGNTPTRLLADPAMGHTFSHWEIDGAALPPSLTEAQIELMITQATSVTAHFNPPATDGEVIHYWHFNDLVTPEDVTSIDADFSAIPGIIGSMTYTGSGPRDIDAVESGSDLNQHLGEPPGRAARVRNPSDGRTLLFEAPTTGFEAINFTYAVERTNNGMLTNILSYSLDGETFVQDGLAVVEFEIEEAGTYYLVNLDFSDIEGADNNPDFMIQIEFEGNTTGTSGNNRFDNISIKGLAIPPAETTQLAILSVNDDQPVYAGEPFFVTVQSQDSQGVPATVATETEVSLSLVTGVGQLSGTLVGTIVAGDETVTISGVVYSQPDNNVALEAAAASLDAAVSEPFEVLLRTYSLNLAANVQGAGEIAGAGQFEAGQQVTISASVDSGFAFEGWFDATGTLFSAQPETSFAMPASNLSYTALFGLPDVGELIHYWHFNDLEDGELEIVLSDFSMLDSGQISFPGIDPGTPSGVMDRRSHNSNNPVSNFNLLLFQEPDSGNVLRVRNPSHENMLKIEAPSTGYQDLVISFATTRTNNGSEEQHFFFSVDSGETWVAVDEPYQVATLDEDGYLARTISLVDFTEVNDNPDLQFRILFVGEAASNESGNNRFDNISVHGVFIYDLDVIFRDGFESDAFD